MSDIKKPRTAEQVSDKNFGIATWAINNKMIVYVIVAIIFIGGLSAFINMPRESFPEVVENKIYISSVYPGNSAEDVEKFITEPIEKEIRGISGITDVVSTSFNDYAMTIVEFADDVPLEVAKADVKDKVDMVKADADFPTLDTGAKVEPNVFDLNIAEEFPIANINLTGNYSLQQLKDFAELLQDEFEHLQAVKEAPIRGVNDKEVEVSLDVYKMAASQVSFNDVAQSISSDNKTISGGNMINQDQRLSIRVVGEITSPQDLLGISVKEKDGVVYLRDIAEIYFREQDKTTYARESLMPVIMMDIKKRSGENMIQAIEDVQKIIERAKENYLPEDVQVNITNNQAPQTQNQVNDLINNIISGMILVVGVLMFFLGFRNANFVGLAIPLSMLLSLMILQFIGVTMNTMVLFGLVMGLGMLVDNGIVVVENVYSLRNQGYSRKQAAIQGVGEIAWPIIISTLTTLAAFFPLAFWPGTIGKFIVIFPITLSVVLGSSLFVAIFINSVMTSEHMLSEVEEKKKVNLPKLIKNSVFLLLMGAVFLISGFIFDQAVLRVLGNLGIFFGIFLWIFEYVFYPAGIWLQEKGLPWLETKYKNFITWSLKGKRPIWMTLSMIGLFIFSIILLVLVQPKVLFFPENEPNQIIVYIEYPEGTDIEKTNLVTQQVEREVVEVLNQYVVEENGENYNFMAEAIIAQVGEGAGNPQTDAGSAAEIPHKGKITVSLREFKDRRGIRSSDVLEEVRESVQGIAGVSITVEKNQVGPPSGYPINIEIQGTDYQKMMDEAERMLEFIENAGIPGIEELKIDVSRDVPELRVNVNRELAGSLGISNEMIGGTLRQSIYGLEVSRFRPDGDDDDYPINIRLKENQRYDENVIFNQPITYTNAATGQILQIPISSLISIEKGEQFSRIKRRGFERTIIIYSNVLGNYNPTETVNHIKNKLEQANYSLADDMTYSFTGEQEDQNENMSFLMSALFMAIAGIVLCLVIQFNSISQPFIILLTIFLSFIGVFLGLIVTGSDFVIIMTMMGIISLAAIVVNNGIILLDYTQLLMDRKKNELQLPEEVMLPIEESKKVIIAGGQSRLRPVLLTAITTILSLLPLALGLNIDFQGLFTNYQPDIYFGGDNVMFWGPLAKTVIYGLTFATFLTLVVVPILQLLVIQIKFRIRYGKKGEKYPQLTDE